MADPAMREAVAYAIDKNEINARLLGGLAQVANTFVSPGAWFYVDQPPTTYDPEKAKQILEDGGWTDGDGDGIREKDGPKAKIELCTTTRQVRQDTLALVSAWLKDVGIDTVINPVDPTNIFADYNESSIDTPCVLSHANFDLAEHATSSSIDPLGNYFSYHSSQFDPVGVNNAGVNDPDIDKALDTLKNSVDFEVILEAMTEMQRVYAEKSVEIPLYYRKQVDLHAASGSATSSRTPPRPVPPGTSSTGTWWSERRGPHGRAPALPAGATFRRAARPSADAPRPRRPAWDQCGIRKTKGPGCTTRALRCPRPCASAHGARGSARVLSGDRARPRCQCEVSRWSRTSSSRSCPRR